MWRRILFVAFLILLCFATLIYLVGIATRKTYYFRPRYTVVLNGGIAVSGWKDQEPFLYIPHIVLLLSIPVLGLFTLGMWLSLRRKMKAMAKPPGGFPVK
jgi:lipoprotein signal peptidase